MVRDGRGRRHGIECGFGRCVDARGRRQEGKAGQLFVVCVLNVVLEDWLHGWGREGTEAWD